jgi:flagellar hook-basal body complex protein FliE
MKSQKPAEGILKTYDWGDSKVYKVTCDCGADDHTHDVWVEADDCNVSVQIYVHVKTPWWGINRFQQIWTLLTKGYLQHETVLTMSDQQALNYAETLKSAIRDVEEFRKKRDVKN